MMAADLVEEAGFDAIEAPNAAEAVLILEWRSDIRILFTDIDMPGSMDGIMLAAAVRDRWSPIEIVIVSGHRRPLMSDLPLRSRFFSKPYQPAAIIEALQAMGR